MEVRVVLHPLAAPADVDDVTVVDGAVDERSGHDFIAEDLAPRFKALAEVSTVAARP